MITNCKLSVPGRRGILKRLVSIQGVLIFWSSDLDEEIIVLKVSELVKLWYSILFSTPEKVISAWQTDVPSAVCLHYCHVYMGTNVHVLFTVSCNFKTILSCMFCIITDVYCWFQAVVCTPVLPPIDRVSNHSAQFTVSTVYNIQATTVKVFYIMKLLFFVVVVLLIQLKKMSTSYWNPQNSIFNTHILVFIQIIIQTESIPFVLLVIS